MFRKIINILLAFSLILLIGCSQSSTIDKSQTVDIQQTLDRSKAPEPSQPKPVTFPKFQETILSNGLNLVLVESHKLPVVSISFAIKGGSYFDGDMTGLSSLTSTLLTKGTATRTAMQIANEIDFLGSNLNSNSTWDANMLTMRTLKKNLNQTFDILADCLLNSTFSEDELQREIAQRIAGLQHNKTDPNYLAGSQLSKVIFGDEHPYGKVSTETSLNSITISDLKAFFNKYFSPDNSYCVIGGDITMKEAVDLLEEKLKDWKKSENEKTLAPLQGETFSVKRSNTPPEIPSTTRVIVVDKTDAVQSVIRVGCVGVDRTNPDYLRLNVLNTYLGGYFRSQLSQKLREEKSYTYGVRSRFDARLLPGPFFVETSVGSEVTAPAIDDILDEIGKLSTTLIPDDRFNEVKNYVMGSFPMGIQTSAQVVGSLANLKLYNMPMNYYDSYISSIQAITQEDLKAMAQKYLDISKISIVISGDNKTVAPTLEKFGKVESIDADGKAIE